VTSVPADPAGVVVPLPGLLLEAGDSARVELVVDVSPAAPASFLELEIAAVGLVATEANNGSAIRIEPPAGFDLPLLSGLTRILPAARDLSVGLASAMPAALVGDGREIDAGTLSLSNDAASGAGAITITGLTVRAADAAMRPIALGATVSRVSAWKNDTLWAESATLQSDSAIALLVPTAPLDVTQGAPVNLELRFATRVGVSAAALRIGLAATDVAVVPPAGGALTVSVHPAAGQTFPLWTEIGNFSDASLAGSWSNFPNPFAGGRERTTFSYWLRATATVTLRLWTLRNEAIVTLVDGVARPAGLQQVDLWDGRNGRGDVVRNGVYVAELTVRYDDGSQDRVLRKVAVVR
jgi:hypothetical protein